MLQYSQALHLRRLCYGRLHDRFTEDAVILIRIRKRTSGEIVSSGCILCTSFSRSTPDRRHSYPPSFLTSSARFWRRTPFEDVSNLDGSTMKLAVPQRFYTYLHHRYMCGMFSG